MTPKIPALADFRLALARQGDGIDASLFNALARCRKFADEYEWSYQVRNTVAGVVSLPDADMKEIASRPWH